MLFINLLLLLSAAPIYQGSPQRIFSNIRTEHLAVFYAGCPFEDAIAEKLKDFFEGAFQTWRHRAEKCVINNVDYVEK